MTRNRVISDIFNRLHLMERRGSGLTRIVESYNDYNIKPTFISDASSFKVVFPNKNYMKKSQFIDKNSPVITGNIVSDEDYFVIKLHKNLPNSVTKSTQNRIQKLFDKYGYQYDFKWENIAETFEIKKSRASEIITLLLDSNLIEHSDPTKYKFKK